MLFENFFTEHKSMDSFELYKLLKPLFNPIYHIERPSGHSSEVIEMRFNSNTSYNDVIDIIKNANWYVVSKNEDGDKIVSIEIRPFYSNFIVKDYPKIVYHITPSANNDSIKENGLLAKNNNKKGVYYPNRIYVSSSIDSLLSIVKELNYYVDTKEWTIWQIDLSSLNLDFLYVDETVNQNLLKPTAFYLQDINIPVSCLIINEEIVL